jgi:hypothetical protein
LSSASKTLAETGLLGELMIRMGYSSTRRERWAGLVV